MNLIELQSSDNSKVLEHLKNKRLFAVSWDTFGNMQYHTFQVSDEEIVFGCHTLINKIIEEAKT